MLAVAEWAGQPQKQIPFEDDNQKNKGFETS
jgi:hypothetical protein